MQQHLYKYLILHHRLSVPGMGNFVIEPVSAAIDGSGRHLLPPLPVIQFRQETALTDKHFYDFLAWEMNVDEVEAINHFRDFTQELKTTAAGNEGALLHGIGNLKITADETIIFHPETNLEEFLPPVTLPDGIVFQQNGKVVKMEPDIAAGNTGLTEEAAAGEKGSPWWIYAAILLLAGISAILFYYA